jgi:putative AdoMet-dependent methyltransferase
MAQPTPASDPFPPSEFDQWASQYDQDVDSDNFPFSGYRRVLDEVARLADPRPGMTVLDLGAGTGNLSQIFLSLGCEVWGTDFSEKMLRLARRKLPEARFYLHDLRQSFPPDLTRPFDRIVSAYVFHHFDLPYKVALIEQLMRNQLNPGGRLVIADISFSTREALDSVREAAGEWWEEEPYWVAAEALPALAALDQQASYAQVSDCAGIYCLSKR